MSDRPVPTQDQADEFKLEAQGHDPADETTTTVQPNGTKRVSRYQVCK